MSGTLIGFTVFGFILLIIGFINLKNKDLAQALMAGFILRGIVVFVGVYIWAFPYSTSADSRRFQSTAEFWVENFTIPEIWAFVTPGSGFFIAYMATLYQLLGTTDWIVIRSINVLLSVLIIFNIYYISKHLWNHKLATQNAWLAAIIPTLIIYGQGAEREAMFVFFLTLGLLFVVLWHRKNQIRFLVFAILSFGFSSSFHEGGTLAIVGLAAYSFLTFLNSFFQGKAVNSGRFALSVVIVILGMFFLYQYDIGLEEPGVGREGIDLEEFVEDRQSTEPSAARAAYLQWLQPGNPLDAIWQTPVRMVYFLFSPFPWMLSTVWDMVGVIDMFIYVALGVGIYKSWPYIRQDPAKATLLVMLVFLVIAFAWGTQNYGTAMRHRAKMIPILLSLAGSVWGFRHFYFDQLHRKTGIKLTRLNNSRKV